MKRFRFLPWSLYKKPQDAAAVSIVAIGVVYITIGAFITLSADLGIKLKLKK